MDKIAVLVPCYNESKTIAKLVTDFKKVLPEATIYVYDRAKALKKPRTKNLSSTVNFINSVLPPTTNEQFIVLILNKVSVNLLVGNLIF